MRIELLRGGSFEIDENDLKTSDYTEDKEGIILEFYKGHKITIKNNETNRDNWISKM